MRGLNTFRGFMSNDSLFGNTKYLFKNKKWVVRALILALADVFVIVFSAIAALWIRYDFSFMSIDRFFLDNAISMLAFDILSTLVIFWFCKL